MRFQKRPSLNPEDAKRILFGDIKKSDLDDFLK